MEWADVWSFIAKWWLEFVLGGAGVILSAITRHYYKLAKQVKNQENKEKQEAFKQELTSEVKDLIKEVRE